MRYVIAAIIIFFVLLFVVISEIRERKIKSKQTKTYSYKEATIVFIIANLVITVISLFIYTITKSAEVTISLGVFMIVCSIASYSRSLLTQYQIKQSGGKKR